MKYSKLIVTAIVAGLAVFTWRVLDIFEMVGAEPAILIGAVFAFATGELWALAGIRKEKVRHEQKGIDRKIDEP